MGQLIKIYPNNPQEAALEKVVRALRDGALIIYPTDTVYGIGCDITKNKALEKLAKLKA